MTTIYSPAALQRAIGVMCLCSACGELRTRGAVRPEMINMRTRGKLDPVPVWLCLEPRTCRERAQTAGRYGTP